MTLSQRLIGLQSAGLIQIPAPIPILFGEWLPDLPALGNPGVLTATNVMPAINSYRPVQDLTVQSDALDARCRGAIAAKDTSGNAYFYCGDETKLYQIRNQTQSEKGTGFSTAAGENWEFTTFKDQVIGTNYESEVQAITTGAGGDFAALFSSTEKPNARHVATVRQFLVVGNTNDSAGVKPNRVRWSGFDDPTAMDISATTQSDFQDLAEGGAVQKIVGGAEYGVIFQEGCIHRMTFSGSPTVFRFDPVDRRRGTHIPNSVIGLGRLIFYISEDGFFAFDGTQSIPIGANKVNKTFAGQFDPANAHLVSTMVDPFNTVVAWAFPGEGATQVANKIYFYDWVNQRFSECDLETQIIVSALTQAFSLDDLDALIPNIDLETISFDDPQWKGGLFRAAAFNTDNKLTYFTGSNLAVTIDTGERQIASGRRSFVERARPLVDGGTVTIAAGSRALQTDTVSFGSDISVNLDGECPLNNDSRYHRFRLKVVAGGTWNHAQGLELYSDPGGEW